MSLTQRERDCLAALHKHTVNGISPTYEELMPALGLKSKNSIFRLISALEDRGYIHRLPRCSRGIDLTGKVLRLLRGAPDHRPYIFHTSDELKQLARDVQAEISRRTPRAAA